MANNRGPRDLVKESLDGFIATADWIELFFNLLVGFLI